MHRGLRISVVIPCFNEERGIRNVIEKMPPCVDQVIVVDNNSTDGTAVTAKSLGATVIFKEEKGYGEAYKAGLPVADGDIIATLDGDGTYPSAAIAPAIDYLVEHQLDFVSASRFPLARRSSMSFRNIVGNKIQTYTMRALFLIAIKDSQSGMWVFRRRVLEKLKLVSSGMSFSEEIKLETLRHKQLRFGEFHIDYYERVGEAKLYPWRDGVLNMWFLFKKRF
jgi:glycosyltransferase involved in cell wall biosynthesis